MANLSNELKKILNSLENNIEDEKTLSLAKTEMFNLYNIFLDEMSKMQELADNRIAELAESQERMNQKLNKIESGLKNIEKDIYIDGMQDEDYDLSITCPYCNKEFEVPTEDLKDEIICPECNNEIELDWGTDSCDGNCSEGGCFHHCDNEDDM
mgnify:CR=1 FL=1